MYKYNLSTEQLENLGDTYIKRIGTVYSIKKDNMQNLYLASISGLWRYNIKERLFRKYDAQDGLLIDEFGLGASAKFKDGRIAFGGAKGAVIFNPIELIKDKQEVIILDNLSSGYMELVHPEATSEETQPQRQVVA